MRLSGLTGPGIGQVIACELVHQDEGIEHHPLAARLQRMDGLHHRLIGRGAAIDGPVLHPRDQLRLGPTNPGNAPRHIGAFDLVPFYLGEDLAGTASQVIAKPRHDQRGRTAVWQLCLQRIERGDKVALSRGAVRIGRLGLSGAVIVMHRSGGQGIFARARHQRHPLHQLGQVQIIAAAVGLFGAQHFERELRHPVAKALQRQVLHHHIGGTAIGWNLPCSLYRLHHRIGGLIHGAPVDRHVEILGRHLFAIGPDTADMGNLSPADRNRQ